MRKKFIRMILVIQFLFVFMNLCAYDDEGQGEVKNKTKEISEGLSVPSLISSNMVLQRNTKVRIWGWASDKETITVSFQGAEQKTICEKGKWEVFFENLKAGESYEMTIQGSKSKNKIEIKNILVGEVWVASGQSNMRFPLDLAVNAKEAIANSSNDQIRFFIAATVGSEEPLETVKGKWVLSSPKTASGFSAVAYFFAKEINETQKAPVGIIQSSKGGTAIVCWISEEMLKKNKNSKQYYDRYKKDLAKIKNDDSESDRKAKGNLIKLQPSGCYNAMINPLFNYTIQGVLWYQGEGDAYKNNPFTNYYSMMKDLITDWRSKWKQGDFPFLFVQLPGFGRPNVNERYPVIRDVQLSISKTIPNTGMVITIDMGEKDDIHPKIKEPVGHRMALLARGFVYGEKIEYTGPIYKSVEYKNGKAFVTFDHVGDGLKMTGDDLNNFTIAGSDSVFVKANAKIEGKNKISVWSNEVGTPENVRYAWEGFPTINLYNSIDIPASPFRTDTSEPVLSEKKRSSKESE